MRQRRASLIRMVSATEKSNPYMAELKATAKKISGRGRGILARYRNRYALNAQGFPCI